MESYPLFPMKYRLRKTDEQVEIIAWDTIEKGARNANDWVSYIDSQGNEHMKEHLTLEWDFAIPNPFGNGLLDAFKTDLPKFDAWEARRYEMVQKLVIENGDDPDTAIELADGIIAALKKSHEAEENPKKGL